MIHSGAVCTFLFWSVLPLHWKFVKTLSWANLCGPFLQHTVLTSCFQVMFLSFLWYFTVFHYYFICFSAMILMISCYYCNLWRKYPSDTFKFANLRYEVMHSESSTNEPLPHLSLFPWASPFWDRTALKVSQLIIIQWSVIVEMKGRFTCVSW